MKKGIVTLKLTTGEEVITIIDAESSAEAFTLHYPAEVTYDYEHQAMGLDPWVLSSMDDVLLGKSAAIAMSVPSSEALALYSEFVEKTEQMRETRGEGQPKASPSTRTDAEFTPSKELIDVVKKIAAGKLLYVSGGDKIN